MNKISKLALLATLFFISTSAFAEVIEIAKDKRGGILLDERGNCIRTKWIADQCCDPCGYEDVLYVNEPEPAPKPEMLVREKLIKYSDILRQSVYFDNDMFNIDSDDETRMNEVIDEITKSKGVTAVRLVGYADRHATDAHNIKLSRKRALNVLNYFNSKGYFTSGDVQYGFYGERRPVTTCPTNRPKAEQIACLQADRRVDIEVDLIRERIETVREEVYKDAQGNIISQTIDNQVVPSNYQVDPSINFEDVESLRRNVEAGR
ncbi:MAG TPA: hypothetical protein DIV86_05560 [Alphaproteobacteria bacterium]|nr:hypothetical protein [Alphaproteobacteria bacterium]